MQESSISLPWYAFDTNIRTNPSKLNYLNKFQVLGYFEVKNTKIVLDEKGVYWKVAVRDNSIKEKPSEYTVNVSYFSSEFK